MLKKLSLLFIALGVFTISYSQLKYGIKGGITKSGVKEGYQWHGMEYSLQTGFQLGFFVDKPITNKLIFRTELQLTQKGYQSEQGIPDGPYWSRNLLSNYLELPLNVLLKIPLNKSSHFYIGSGPVVSYGLYGRLKMVLTTIDNNQELVTESSTGPNVFNEPNDHRFDFGWDFIMGAQYRKMVFNASYNHGLTNILEGDNSMKFRTMAVSVGYLFN